MKLLFSIATTLAVSAMTALSAQAAAPGASVVKVTSGDCQSAAPMRGSGLVFTRQGKTYVVTSDHVVFHANGKYCHHVFSPKLGDFAATYLTSEWGNGLALLEVPGLQNPADAPALDDLPAKLGAGLNEAALVTGFPFASQSLIADKRGVFVSLASTHAFFVTGSPLLEILGSHGEYGMSGGPVFDAGGKFAGILSHQVVQKSAGDGSDSAVEWHDGQAVQNHLLAISGAGVRAWLDTYFKDPAGFETCYYVEPGNQGDSSYFLYTGQLLLSLSASTDPYNADLRGTYGASIDLSRWPADSKIAKLKYQFPIFKKFEDLLRAHPEYLALELVGFRAPSLKDEPALLMPRSVPDFFAAIQQVDQGKLIALLLNDAQDGWKVKDQLADLVVAKVQNFSRTVPYDLQLWSVIYRIESSLTGGSDVFHLPDTWWKVRAADIDEILDPTHPIYSGEWKRVPNEFELKAVLKELRDLLAKLTV